jgi:ABC-type Fe3+ transport system substrate-binding protein
MSNEHFTIAPPLLGQLDVLGRVPVPLRRAFAAGMDSAAELYRDKTGVALKRWLLTGAEWYKPFDGLMRASDASGVPRLLITTLQSDVLDPKLLTYYRPRAGEHPPPMAAAMVRDAGLPDPEGCFRLFGFVPFVWLIDERRLQGRPRPRAWSDLLDPMWQGEIVFGGHRSHEDASYSEYNGFLLDCLHSEFGLAGVRAFAPNVRHLQHNVRTATLSGSNSSRVGTIAILPWMQAELCPRRERIGVVWPEDGALTMPMAYLSQPGAEARLQPIIDYLTGDALAAVLARNCYPSSGPRCSLAPLPTGARLKWPGWDYFRHRDMTLISRTTAETFFETWYAAQEAKSCV